QAAARNPMAIEPYLELSAIYDSLGDVHRAHAALVSALHLQPENPATWSAVGAFDLQHRAPHKALGVLERAHRLDLTNTLVATEIDQATAVLRILRQNRRGTR